MRTRLVACSAPFSCLPRSQRGCLNECLPVPRMRRPCTPPDQRDTAKREACRPLELAEREVLEQRQDVALEGAEIDEPSRRCLR